MIASVAGERIAAPMPWIERAAIRRAGEGESAQSRDAPEKRRVPAKNMRRRPNRSEARPPSSRKPAKVRV